MKLDYLKLKNNFDLLFSKIEKEKDPKKLAMLRNDLIKTKKLLNPILTTKDCYVKNFLNDKALCINENEENLYLYDEEYLKSLVNFLNNDAKKLFEMFYSYGNIHRVPVKNSLSKPIKEEYLDFYINLLDGYLINDTNKDLYPIYKNMKENGQIEINNNLKKGQSICSKMETFPESYVLFNNKDYEGFLNLIGNVAEADSFIGLKNTELIQNKKLSFFADTYFIFYKLLYNYDFSFGSITYKNPAFINSSLKSEGHKLLEFVTVCDHYVDIILAKADYEVTNKGHLIPKGSLKHLPELRTMFSNALAFYFYELYKKDPQEGLRQVEDFKYMLGMASDKDIFEYFNFGKLNIKTGMEKSYNDYIKRLKK